MCGQGLEHIPSLLSGCGEQGSDKGEVCCAVLGAEAAGDSPLGWGIAFGHLAVVTLLGLTVVRRLGQSDRH